MKLSAADRHETPEGVSYFIDNEPEPADFLSEVLSGFSKLPKSVPPKFFYDEVGLNLFNKICKTTDYYVTRTEVGLLKAEGPEISEQVGPSRAVIEYGCGSSLKINALLNALNSPTEYTAIDISRGHLLQTVAEIAVAYPSLKVGAICADFSLPLNLPSHIGKGVRRLAFFPGSTIGNQSPEDAVAFLQNVRTSVGSDGNLLIGVDLEKDSSILNAAYNDKEGYTAAFNVNLIHRINRELGGDLDPNLFRHHAYYNENLHRIEMHLISERKQEVFVGGRKFYFEEQEVIHTENSYKYSVARFSDLAVKAGFHISRTWVDSNLLFSIHYLDAD